MIKGVRTHYTTGEIDAMLAKETVDELLTMNEVETYLGLTHWNLKTLVKNKETKYLKPHTLNRQDVYRVSDLRRYLAWRKMLWTAAEAEKIHAPSFMEG